MPLDKQERTIQYVREHADDSYHFVGEPNTGKTHLAYGVFRRSVKEWAERLMDGGECCQAVWATTVPGWLLNVNRWKTRNFNDEVCTVEQPGLMPHFIRNAAKHGYRPVVLLDEVDKFSPTDSKLESLQEVVNAVYEASGQMILTTNADFHGLANKWGADMACTILRRCAGDEGGHTIKFAA